MPALTTAEVLGLSPKQVTSPIGLIEQIEGGLPFATLDRITGFLAPGDTQFKYRFVPRATWSRRKAAHKLSLDEGTKLARVAKVYTAAVDAWGSKDEARDFLFRAHPMINDKLPIDVVMKSEIGADLVMDILGRLKYGTAA
ncbi:antitoxin [Labrys miyagiensis]|uniref:Antitoxin n=1 Tax=Labrys miyagiensis TaxID=346912 RepID=A0ABQ6CMI3_9HYPH|nr:antitoxin Xre/MbcA/ParS toxin-binding domain-containing protein [Labrys miyagiensis]GLS21572.1 antitoxin [Labrys miyagiensis]